MKKIIIALKVTSLLAMFSLFGITSTYTEEKPVYSCFPGWPFLYCGSQSCQGDSGYSGLCGYYNMLCTIGGNTYEIVCPNPT